ATPVPTPATTPTPVPAATPAPTAAPAQTAGVPKVTKSPTDETVDAGGSCWFVAKYENAIWAVWHFVSPDGKTDLSYDQINTQFPKLEVTKGYASTTQLKNIPAEMNGWKVYCRFSNNTGSVDTGKATVTVRGTQTAATGGTVTTTPVQTAGVPKVTKSPTGETVDAGGSCWFVAKYENAIWAEWHFVSPDGKTDLTYDRINTLFPDLEVTKGYASTTQLKNIPAEMSGWRVYCRFSNNSGSVDTDMAAVTVRGTQTAAAGGTVTPTPTPTPTPTSSGGTVFQVQTEQTDNTDIQLPPGDTVYVVID
ncbi:MAG: hypothetical protein IJV40_05245, partial [Oscillospiraceae bacterium]|nr:hypothetical protein [Oscillospiraceae bacterium]